MPTETITPIVASQEARPGCCVPLDSGSLHDLFSPANQVRSIADLVVQKYGGALDAEAEVLFGFIQAAANRLQNLLCGLRTYTNAVGPRSPIRLCDANVLLESAVDLARHEIDRSGAAITHGTLPDLCCDPTRIACLFASLIDNSIKFRGESKPEIHVSADAGAHLVVLSFRDNGIGIDPRHHERIFGVFARIHNEAYPGAGMGLAIARKIMEGHGGRIWVDSALNQGARFFLEFPQPQKGGIDQ